MAKSSKYGVFSGVFTPAILTILGVIMYLRLPWITGQAGLFTTISIIIVAHIISITTGLSVSSIATDKKIGTGGAYYVISRSLGLPIGGTLGLALFLGLSLSISLYIIGFTEVLLKTLNMEVNLFSIRVAGSITLLFITVVTFISTSLNIKAQYIIMVAMVLSLLSVFLGKHDFSPASQQFDVLPESLPWITLFAIFFPAATGFETGISMSGDLRDPRKAIPRGTLSAIVIGFITYIALAVFFSMTVDRQLLVNDPDVLLKISLVPQIVIAGILGATLSSALGSINASPRIMQALAKDRISPYFLSKGHGPMDEPRTALILTFVIAEAGILIGELNTIARLVTIFFVLTYGFMNITYAIESWASSDFMPTFKIPRIVSIIGALTCIIIMIQLDVIAFLIASILLGSLFMYFRRKELTLQSGDTRSSFWQSLVRTGLFRLLRSQVSNRNWRPNVILFSGGIKERPHLIEISESITGRLGIMTNFELVENPEEDMLFDKTASVSIEDYGQNTNIITRRHAFRNIYDGIGMISRVYGFAGFEPNTILMGWARHTDNPGKLMELLLTLNKLDYSLAFLKYDKSTGFGKYKRIDFWWSGSGRNLSLALHLMRFINASHKWRNAELRILAINPESVNDERFYSLAGQATENYRVRTNVKVINNVARLSVEEIMGSESLDTDLIILEHPDFIRNDVSDVIARTNKLTDTLGTCLIIHASSAFEEINVSAGLPDENINVYALNPEQRPDAANLNAQGLSGVDIISNELSGAALIIKKQSEEFLNDTFFSILENRNNLTDNLTRITERTFERLKLNGVAGEKLTEYLNISGDYADQALKLLIQIKNNQISFENKILRKGILRFLHKSEEAINTLPTLIRREFPKEEFRHFKPRRLTGQISRTAVLIWLSISRKKKAVNISVLPAARYYIYRKRLEFFMDLCEKFNEQNLKAFAMVRGILIKNKEVIEKAVSGKLTGDELIKEGNDQLTHARELRSENQLFIYGQGNRMIAKLGDDLKSFGKMIEGPRANYMAARFNKVYRKSETLKEKLSEFPEIWLKFMTNHVNRTYMDFIFLSLGIRLTNIIGNAQQEIGSAIEQRLLFSLSKFEEQVRMLEGVGNGNGEKQKIISQNMIELPKLDNVFARIIKEVKEAVEELPETLEITGDPIPDNMSFENIRNINDFAVSVRKTADYFISTELGERIKKQSLSVNRKLSDSVSTIRDLIRLASFNLDNIGNYYNALQIDEQVKILRENLINNIGNERDNILRIISELNKSIDQGLKNALEPLSSAVIVKTSRSLSKVTRETDKQKISYRLRKILRSTGEKVTNQYVKLLYGRSEGLLWANRLDQLRQKEILFQGDEFSGFLKKISPDNAVMQDLPFYYSNLFSGSSSIGEDFWVGMEEEISEGSRAVRSFSEGNPGMLIITGERSSGKSSLSKHLANLHFSKQNIFSLRAPLECTASAELFEETLLKNIYGTGTLTERLEALPGESVIIINDLELWWERKPSGTQVVEKIISLVRQFGKKILFIVNVNQHSLKIINQLSSVNSWALGLVFCQPSDARELRDLILIRHRASGMKFILNKKEEDSMTKREYARLFNRIFNLSSGNPGYAMNLWLAGIKKISDSILYIDPPPKEGINLPGTMKQEEIIFILQFVLHRRFSVKNLSSMLQNDSDSTEKTIQLLLRKGLLIEKFPGIYSLNPALEILLVKKLKNLELV